MSSRDPIPTWFFALVVVRAARRETLEETGVPITLTGVLCIEHSPASLTSRMRIIYLAEPTDDTKPKSIPGEESLGAEWAWNQRVPCTRLA